MLLYRMQRQLSMETINRQLTEKRATVMLFRRMGADPAVVKKEMA